MEKKFTHTVHCYDDRSLRKHFENVEAATAYANELLRAGHKVRVFPYHEPRRYVDIVAERGPDG